MIGSNDIAEARNEIFQEISENCEGDVRMWCELEGLDYAELLAWAREDLAQHPGPLPSVSALAIGVQIGLRLGAKVRS